MGREEQPVFVDWIEMPSGAYIDTGIIPNENLFFDINFKPISFTSDDNAIPFLVVEGDISYGVACFTDGNTYYFYGRQSGSGAEVFNLSGYNNIRADYWDNKWCSVVNNTTAVSSQFPMNAFQFTQTLLINGGSVQSINRYKNLKFYTKNGNVIENFYAAYYKGEYGLWDTINNKFYGNSGTDAITGGYD